MTAEDRIDRVIISAIDLAADRAKVGDVGRIDLPIRRPLTADERANLLEYAALSGVGLVIFDDHVNITGPRVR